MQIHNRFMLCLFALLPLSVHAGTRITERHEIVTEEIPKPAHIWVYDFAATAADVPAGSDLAGQVSEHSKPQTPEQIATGRKLGAEIAAELVKDIRAMGMPAERPMEGTKPQINDLVIRGYLVSVVAGSEKKRIAIGFGSGESELKVAVEGFQVTADGLRKLGGGSTDSTGGKAPGASLGVVGLIALHSPIGLIASTGMKVHDEKTGESTLEGRARDTAKEIASVLRERFQEQGWIEELAK
jgi:hypothetical protein